MEELKKYLKRLPQEDFDNAIEYFSEYFEEAGPEKEQQVMRELGEPKEAARELFLNLLQESVEKDQDIVEEKAPVLKGKRRSPGKIILLVFLVLCASPVSLALLAFVFAVLCAVSSLLRSDFFDWYLPACGDSRRYCDHRGWGLFDPEICCSSLYDGRRWIPDDGNWNPRRSFDCIYLQMVCKWDRTSVNRLVRKKVHKNE